MKKFIFLDIDGVLNSWHWWQIRTDKKDHLDPDQCKLVNDFCLAENAQIIISSTWRILQSLSDIRAFLIKKGCTAPITGKTPRFHPPLEIDSSIHGRGLEIQLFLRNYDLSDTGIVIFDDDSNMSDLKPFLVQTDFSDGLLHHHIDVAHNIINTSLMDSPHLGGPGKIEWKIDALKLLKDRS
jgi:hypothetical protein